MKKCPNCKSLNDLRNTCCNSCGYNFITHPKSNSFRNFIIIASVFFSTVIIGLAVFLVLNSNLAVGLISSVSTANDQAASATDNEKASQSPEITEEQTSQLSSDQEKLLSMFGYPDMFIVLFDEGNANKRIDSWGYKDLETCFIFEDGVYSDYSEFITKEIKGEKYFVKPQEFFHGMNPSGVELLVGEKGNESIDNITGLKLLIFGGGELICVFNPDDALIIVNKNNTSDT